MDTRFLIIGDSYVRRLKEYCVRQESVVAVGRQPKDCNLHLDNVSVSWYGEGGGCILPQQRGTLSRKYIPGMDLQRWLQSHHRHHIAIIQLGSNDLGFHHVSACDIVESTISFANSLLAQGFERVILSEPAYRFYSLPRRGCVNASIFNAKTISLREELDIACRGLYAIDYVHAARLRRNGPAMYLRDGIHYNERGNAVFYGHIRGIVHRARVDRSGR